MAFSEGDLRTIAAFAAQMGLAARSARDGTFGFAFEEAGTLTLTSSADGERTCMTLARRLNRIDEGVMRRALAAAGWDAAANVLLQACLSADGDLLLTLGFERDALSLPAMEAVLQTLMAKFHAIL